MTARHVATPEIPVGAEILSAALGMVGGAFAAMVWTRTQFSVLTSRQNKTDDNLRQMQESFGRRAEAMERRQVLQLQISADIARKIGADGRFSDALVRYLAEDATDSHNS